MLLMASSCHAQDALCDGKGEADVARTEWATLAPTFLAGRDDWNESGALALDGFQVALN
jgi:hypothetical protein